MGENISHDKFGINLDFRARNIFVPFFVSIVRLPCQTRKFQRSNKFSNKPGDSSTGPSGGGGKSERGAGVARGLRRDPGRCGVAVLDVGKLGDIDRASTAGSTLMFPAIESILYRLSYSDCGSELCSMVHCSQ